MSSSDRRHEIFPLESRILAVPLRDGMRGLLPLTFFIVAYYAAYRYAMSFAQTAASPFWFPDSILLCALLLTRPKSWWLIVLSTLLIRLFTSVPPALPMWFLFIAFAIDSIKGVAAAAILNRLVRNRSRLDTLQSFALFCLVAVIIVPAIGAFGGAVARSTLGYPFSPAWTEWFLGDALVQLIVSPALLYWVPRLWGEWRTPTTKRVLEAILLGLGLVVCSHMEFGPSSATMGLLDPWWYLTATFLLWAAVRFEMAGASAAILLTAFLSVSAALEGRGPFSGHAPHDTALYLQHFLLWKAVPVYVVAVLITHRMGVEGKLRESETRFRNMADFAPLLIWVSGSDGSCTYLNQKWLEFTGCTLDQEEGDAWAKNVHPQDLEHCFDEYRTASRSRTSFVREYQLRRHDGQYRWMLDQGVPRICADGTFLGYIGSCVDFTDRKLAEAELRRQHMELAHIGRISTLGLLVSGLTHELSQPLAAILSNVETAELTLQGASPDLSQIRAIVEDLRASSLRATDVIDRLRKLLVRRELDCKPCSIQELVENVSILVRSEMRDRRISMTCNIAHDLPLAFGDTVHLQQVLLNLLINAADAVNDCGPEQRQIAIHASATEPQWIEVAVQDAGPGILHNQSEKIFEPFFTTKTDGMGLGLAISRTIIESHGGRLRAANNDGAVGATFTFSLKVVGEGGGAVRASTLSAPKTASNVICA